MKPGLGVAWLADILRRVKERADSLCGISSRLAVTQPIPPGVSLYLAQRINLRPLIKVEDAVSKNIP